MHSLEALDEGSGTEMRTEGHRRHFPLVRRARLPSFFFHPAALLRFLQNVEALLSHPCYAYYYLSIPFHARHWLWTRLGLKAAVGQTITPTTDEANLFIRIGYQNIPVNLDEAQRQIGIHTEYSIMSARSA